MLVDAVDGFGLYAITGSIARRKVRMQDTSINGARK